MLVYGLQGLLAGSLVSDDRAISLLLILVLLSPLQALDGLLMGMFAVFSKPRAIFFRKYVLTPGLRLTVVLLLVLGGQSVVFLAAGYVATAAFGVALYALMLYRMLREEGLLDRLREGGVQVPAREVFGFTIPLLTSDLVYMAMNTSDVILLGHFGGATDVGAFRVIGPAAQLNQLVMSSFTLLFTPLAARMFAREDREGINELYWQTAIWIAVLSFPLFALTFSLAEPVTSTLFGERYEGSGVYLSLLSLGYYFNAALGFNGLTLKVYGRLRYIVTINILAALVNLGLNFILIPRYGALGAAIGTCGDAHRTQRPQAGRAPPREASASSGAPTSASTSPSSWRPAPSSRSSCAFSPPALLAFAVAALASLAVVALSRRSLACGADLPRADAVQAHAADRRLVAQGPGSNTVRGSRRTAPTTWAPTSSRLPSESVTLCRLVWSRRATRSVRPTARAQTSASGGRLGDGAWTMRESASRSRRSMRPAACSRWIGRESEAGRTAITKVESGATRKRSRVIPSTRAGEIRLPGLRACERFSPGISRLPPRSRRTTRRPPRAVMAARFSATDELPSPPWAPRMSRPAAARPGSALATPAARIS